MHSITKYLFITCWFLMPIGVSFAEESPVPQGAEELIHQTTEDVPSDSYPIHGFKDASLPESDEPIKISSTLGTQNLKLYKLPFEDNYPTGPFEKLEDKQYLFITKCGEVYFTKLGEKLELIKPGKSLFKYIPRG